MKKKFALFIMALLCGVLSGNATAKRVFVNVQVESWRNNASGIRMHIWDAGAANTDWGWDTFKPLTRIDATDWYYIDIDSEETEAGCLIVTNESSIWQTANASIDFSKKNIIYLYDDNGAKLSIQNYEKFVLANTDRERIVDLEQDGYVFSGTLDLTGASGDTYFAIFPFKNSAVGEWSYCFRPITDGADYALNNFIVYNSNTTSFNNGHVYKEMMKLKYEVVFNLVAGTCTFTPYFERTFDALLYNTYSYGYDAVPESGVEAFYAQSATASNITFKKLASGIAANDGALLKAGTAGTYKFYPAASSLTTQDGNLMKPMVNAGTVTASADGTYHYVFAGNTEDNLGFYNLTANKDLAAGTAYLECNVAPAAARMNLVFEDETTGISNMTTVDDNVYYNMQGVRVAQPTRGLYIVNGKKMFVK